MRLPLSVPFHADETVTSFLSRLAAWNGTDARRFCLDFRLGFQAVVDGDEAALRKIADLGGLDPDLLQKNALAKVARSDRDLFTYRGEILARSCMRRIRVAICPACLRADIKRHPKLPERCAVYGRTAWLINAVRICPIHKMELAVVCDDPRSDAYDFSLQVWPALKNLEVLVEDAVKRNVGPLEKYLLARLQGERQSDFLDAMPLYAAIRLCETAGAVMLFGPKVDLKKLPDAKWLAAGGRGYEELASGPDAMRVMLGRLKSDAGGRNRQDGPSVAFGRLYTLMNTTRDNPAFRAAREIVAGYIHENFALDPEQSVFGKPVRKRKLHSIHTLSLETSLHPKTLRKNLLGAGLIDGSQADMSDHNVLFDAAHGAKIAKALSSTLSLAKAGEHLGAPRSQMDVLVKSGLVKPTLPVSTIGAQARYATADLDAFLEALRRNAVTADRSDRNVATIPDAARQACRSAAEVVQLILDGDISTAVRRRTDSGFLAVLVDPRKVVSAVRGPENDGISLRRVASLLETSDRVVTALIDQKHLATFRARNPVNRCVQTLVATAELERFKQTYVSLWALSKERGQEANTVKALLDRAGIKPAFDHEKIRARFYRRSEC